MKWNNKIKNNLQQFRLGNNKTRKKQRNLQRKKSNQMKRNIPCVLELGTCRFLLHTRNLLATPDFAIHLKIKKRYRQTDRHKITSPTLTVLIIAKLKSYNKWIKKKKKRKQKQNKEEKKKN